MSLISELRTRFEEHEIRRVKIGAFDVDGVLRGKYISLDKFWSVVQNGMGFCDVIFGWDSSDQLYEQPGITGWHTGYPDTNATIDLDTFRLIPWEPNTASFLLDFQDTQNNPLLVSPRQVLRRVLDKADGMDVKATMAVEYELFIYEETPWSLRDKRFADLKPLDPGMFGYSWLRTSQSSNLVHELLDATEQFDCPIEGFHTETGPGVFEAALRYTDALDAADRASLFKTAVKEICSRHGLTASFMAKPAQKLPGCSGHIHQSLWSKDGSANLFYSPAAERRVSDTCRQYIAGQIALMPELCSMVAPNVNSYKRLLGGDWAPSHATWGYENRTCALRVIPGSEKSTRIEYRLSGSDLNPYIAMAALIGAGLYGIEKGLTPPPPIEGNAYEADPSLLLPTSLASSVQKLRSSEVAPGLLSKTFVDHYVMTREWEVKQYEKSVSDWETARYFELA